MDGADRHRDISIHALREEGDRVFEDVPHRSINFYPRPPRGGRLLDPERIADDTSISIHALREEGDAALTAVLVSAVLISIHALREEGDGCCL